MAKCPAMNTLTERIRSAREEAGLSQADVAKALRISASAVNQWEQGLTKNMKLNNFFALANLLGQDPRWLATGKMLSRVQEPAVISPKSEYSTLTSEEKALLHYVRRLPVKLRKTLLKFIRGLGDAHISLTTPAAER